MAKKLGITQNTLKALPHADARHDRGHAARDGHGRGDDRATAACTTIPYFVAEDRERRGHHDLRPVAGADGDRVLDADAAACEIDLLRGVVTGGTGTGASVPGWQLAGKTGTTDRHADAVVRRPDPEPRDCGVARPRRGQRRRRRLRRPDPGHDHEAVPHRAAPRRRPADAVARRAVVVQRAGPVPRVRPDGTQRRRSDLAPASIPTTPPPTVVINRPPPTTPPPSRRTPVDVAAGHDAAHRRPGPEGGGPRPGVGSEEWTTSARS